MPKPVQQLVLMSISFIVLAAISVVSIRIAIAQSEQAISSAITVAPVSDEKAMPLERSIKAIVAQASTKSPSTITINPDTGVPDGAILLTVFLKHDQSKTLDQILAELQQSGYWKAFPPEGVNVVSWYVVMGIGQVVTLAVPPDRLRAVNTALERTAWKAYRTEFYATYDFMSIAKKLREQANSR